MMQSAEIYFNEHNRPCSNQFQDIYFSNTSPIEESDYVFIQGSKLEDKIALNQNVTIAEAGFGTGLNFLLTRQSWRKKRKPFQWLHYYAIEAFPLTAIQLKRCLSQFHSIESDARQLIEQYPNLDQGFHNLNFPEDHISLSLIFLPIEQALNEFPQAVDIWYLDGFSPAKNPEMWTDTILKKIGQNCLKEGRVTTFTAAGAVKRGLEAAGFQVEKIPGFGQKRNMLIGKQLNPDSNRFKSWAKPASKPLTPAASVGIIGGGIAGLSISHLLSQRGFSTHIFEKNQNIAMEGSGNIRGLISPAFQADASISSMFYRQAFQSSVRQIESLNQYYPIAHQFNGMERISLSDKDSLRFRKSLMNNGISEDTAIWKDYLKWAPDRSALHFKQTGWVAPGDWAQALSKSAESIHTQTEINAIHYEGEQWHLQSNDGSSFQVDSLVITAGIHSLKLNQSAHLPLSAKRGHVVYLPPQVASQSIQKSLSGQYYLLPVDSENPLHLAGSSFEHLQKSEWFDTPKCQPVIVQEIAQEVREYYKAVFPDPFSEDELDKLEGRAGIRCTTPDHLPLCGPLPDLSRFQSFIQPLSRGVPDYRLKGEAPYHPKLFILTGLGARGLSSVNLCSEIITAWITGSGFPVNQSIVQALHPSRYLIRAQFKPRH